MIGYSRGRHGNGTLIHRQSRSLVGLILGLLLISGLFLGLWPAPAMATEVTAPAVVDVPPQPVVLSADDTGLVLEWTAPDFSQSVVTGDDGQSYVALDTPGWMQTNAPGQPQLPVASALAVVPPAGDVTLSVQVLEQSLYDLAYPILPASEPVVVGEYPFTSIQWTWDRDDQAYGEGLGEYSRTTNPCSLGAAGFITLEEAGWQRGRRLMRLTFSPFCFAPARLAAYGFDHFR